MQRKTIKISDLLFNEGQIQDLPSNPRKISDEKFEKLKKSINELPEMTEARDLLVVPYEGKYVVIGGNMRLKAYKALGWKQAPCCVLDEKKPEKLRQIVMQDNNAFGETDWAMVAADWDLEELEDWGVDVDMDWGEAAEEKKEVVEDEFSEEVEARVKRGEIWQLGEHRLMCGDSTSEEDVKKLMDGEEADLYLTDPPYNVAYEGKTKDALRIQNDSMNDESFRCFLIDAFERADAVIKKGASFYIWHADLEGFNFRYAVRSVGWDVKQCLIWNKNAMVMGRQDYQWKHEPCLYGWKKGASHHWYSDRKQTTVLEFNKPLRNGEHPTMKPVELFAYLITNSSREKDLVLDSFGGSGTTIIACEQLNRRCRMIELDEHYCDVIINRWEKLTGKEAQKIYG